MVGTESSSLKDAAGSLARVAQSAAGPLNVAIEAIVLIMVCLSPWALGCVGAEFEFYLFAGIALLLVLWAARMLAEWRVSWQSCPVVVCLAGMIMLGVLQLTPLSRPTLDRISPGTTRFGDRLLPAQPEVLPRGEPREIMLVPAGSTISLYPDPTRKSLTYLLALFSLYVIVRNNVSSMGAVRRISIAVCINGAALSLFGLIQFFGNTEPGRIYWTYSSSGSPFGPFVNRNHFAFYINLCIGFSLGLLLARSQSARMHDVGIELPMIKRITGTLRDLLYDPGALWISGGLALMVSSVVFCLSRGGFVALIGAATLCTMLLITRGAGNWRICATLLSVGMALGLLSWFGLERVEARLATLWTGQAVEDGRVFLLTHAWPLIKEFPVLGTGYGTFQFVEPLYMHTVGDIGTIYEHAHNDYLESLIEGGSVGLMLRLITIALVFQLAYRAFRVHSGTTTAALALGLLFAFTSIVIHSFFEFGLYVPAIVVLAVVLCAHIGGLSEYAEPHSPTVDAETELVPRSNSGVWVVAPLVGAVIAVLLGSYLYNEGSKASTISTLRSEARKLRRAAFAGTVDRTTEIPLLQMAARLNPYDAERRLMLAEAYLDIYKQRTELDAIEPQPLDEGPRDSETTQYLVKGLRNVLFARDLGPLLPTPNARIAFYRDELVTADPRSVYLERVKFLAPVDPQLWYLCGLQEIADRQTDEAWNSWRRSLQLSDRFLTRILDRAATVLSPEQLLENILPDQPAILLAAAMYLYPQPEAATDRQPFISKAISLYDDQQAMDPAQWQTKGVLHVQLGQPAKAIQAYQAALANDPSQIGWRYELARLLYQQGRLNESRHELILIRGQQPNHAAAEALLKEVARDAAERRTSPSVR